MPLSCPACHRTLPASDEPPRFCAYCGTRLPDQTRADGPPATTGPFQPSAAEPEPAPAEIGGYRILRLLGSGGMGQVYEAEPVGGGPHVAVKVLSGRLQANPVSVERFRQEGRLAAQIAHPRCVFVLRADADRGRPYIVMELMPGDTLKDLVDRKKAVPAPESIRLILDVIDGLQEAHRLGVIHRDVKPSNCFLLPDGRVKVGDFGLSKSLGSAAQLTTSGAFLGTVLYASPEQIKGEPVDFASDVYSVCATLYHVLAGRAPFHHENPTAVLARIISEDPPDVRSVNPAVPADLARVVHRGLERDRDRRYATLGELRADLMALVPEQLTFGGMGVRVAAYVLDDLLVRLAALVPTTAVATSRGKSDWVEVLVTLSAFLAYFTVTEGLWGRSVGKWLLGLRVCRQGTTLGPGLRRAAGRALAFALLFMLPIALADVRIPGDPTDGLLSFLPLVAGLVALAVPMRRSNDFRGLHETLSGTWVLRLPVVPRPLKLLGRHGDRLAAVPPRPAEFPETVGSYAVGHAVRVGDQWVAVGDDQVLGRRVLLRLYPDRGGPPLRGGGERPGRLRPLGHGTATVGGVACRWDAYMAPAGAPLTDVVDRDHPVHWPEARAVLEQLAAELAAAQKDGSLPGRLSLDQVWVQPDGRPQLLDFPLGPAAGLTDAVGLLRQSAATLLEGAPRQPNDLTPVRAPSPRHAEGLLARLAGGPPAIGSPAEFAAELAGTAGQPTRVTRRARGVQLLLQAGTLGIGLLVMFAAGGMYAAYLAGGLGEYQDRARRVRSAESLVENAAAPGGRSRLEEFPVVAEVVRQDPNWPDRLPAVAERARAELDALPPGANAAERTFLRAMAGAWMDSRLESRVAAARQLEAEPISAHVRRGWREVCLAILVWPALWAAAAFVLRGGVSYLLTGIRIARTVGGPATRRQCALRALLVWGPVALLLCACVFVRAEWPTWGLGMALWWAALLLMPAYISLALLDPERGPHDRLLGTWLVPR